MLAASQQADDGEITVCMMLQGWQTLQPYSRNTILLGGNFESTANSWNVYGATINSVWCAVVKQKRTWPACKEP